MQCWHYQVIKGGQLDAEEHSGKVVAHSTKKTRMRLLTTLLKGSVSKQAGNDLSVAMAKLQ